jgi:pSer/pThr/pTyr-binding forkhead associated (FHA) protein
MEPSAKTLRIDPCSPVGDMPAAEKPAPTMQPAASLISLFTPDGPALGERVRLDNPPVLMGRSPERCRVVLPLNAIGREHAQIDFIKGQYVITDLDSRGGVHVNNERIPKNTPTALKDGDRIKICDFLFCFHDESEEVNKPNGDVTDKTQQV